MDVYIVWFIHLNRLHKFPYIRHKYIHTPVIFTVYVFKYFYTNEIFLSLTYVLKLSEVDPQPDSVGLAGWGR